LEIAAAIGMSSEGEDAAAMRKELDSLKDGREKEAEERKGMLPD
jgi:hypothetical protein